MIEPTLDPVRADRPRRNARAGRTGRVGSVCPWRAGLAGLAALTALSAGAGCTERVVAARGFGADRVTIEEPYQESGQIDRWIFGEEPGVREGLRGR